MNRDQVPDPSRFRVDIKSRHYRKPNNMNIKKENYMVNNSQDIGGITF